MKSLHIGTGPARAALVPGHGLCAEFYVPFALRLADRGVPSVLFTLPGSHGEPPLPDLGWSPLVDAVLAEVPPGAALLGHSMGGLVALLAAARRPPISHLVLLEPAAYASRALAALAARGYARTAADRFDNWNGGQWRVADPSRYPPERIALFLEGLRSADTATTDALFSDVPVPSFDRGDVPTLLVTGGAIGWRGRAMAAHLARHVRPTARFVLPDAGHWLVNEHDDTLANAIADFILR